MPTAEFDTLDATFAGKPEVRSELRGKLRKIVASVLLGVTIQTQATAVFKPFGLPEDESYLKEQVLRLLEGYNVEKGVFAPRESIVKTLDISDDLRTMAQEVENRWAQEIAA